MMENIKIIIVNTDCFPLATFILAFGKPVPTMSIGANMGGNYNVDKAWGLYCCIIQSCSELPLLLSHMVPLCMIKQLCSQMLVSFIYI